MTIAAALLITILLDRCIARATIRLARAPRRSHTAAALLLASGLAACGASGHAVPVPAPIPLEASTTGSKVVISDTLLAKTIVRIRALSPAFDSAMVALVHSGITVFIGGDVELKKQIPKALQRMDEWQAVTTTYPLTPVGGRGRPIEHAAVIVRLEPLREALLAVSNSAADVALIERYLERVLAHEIYGHLMPQLQLGRTAPIACDDPDNAETWYSACVMVRERHVVAELSRARRSAASALVASRQ